MSNFPFDLSKLDLGKLLGLARELKERLNQMEQTLAGIKIETFVGGGMVSLTANARGEMLSLQIDPELLSPENKTMLENLVLAAVNQASREAQRRREEEMQKISGLLPLAGIF